MFRPSLPPPSSSSSSSFVVVARRGGTSTEKLPLICPSKRSWCQALNPNSCHYFCLLSFPPLLLLFLLLLLLLLLPSILIQNPSESEGGGGKGAGEERETRGESHVRKAKVMLMCLCCAGLIDACHGFQGRSGRLACQAAWLAGWLVRSKFDGDGWPGKEEEEEEDEMTGYQKADHKMSFPPPTPPPPPPLESFTKGSPSPSSSSRSRSNGERKPDAEMLLMLLRHPMSTCRQNPTTHPKWYSEEHSMWELFGILHTAKTFSKLSQQTIFLCLHHSKTLSICPTGLLSSRAQNKYQL